MQQDRGNTLRTLKTASLDKAFAISSLPQQQLLRRLCGSSGHGSSHLSHARMPCTEANIGMEFAKSSTELPDFRAILACLQPQCDG
jgi:hypothetical protein